MKRTFLFLAIFHIVFSAVIYAGGSGEGKVDSGGGAKRIKIVYGDWALAEDVLQPIYQKCIDSFTSKNPDIDIETFSMPYANYLDQLLIAGAVGNAPDAIRAKNEWVPQFSATGALRDTRKFIDKTIIDDYYPGALDSLTVNSDLVGLPWLNSFYILYYNKTLLAKAGITTLPRTLDELIAAAYKISSLDKDTKGNKLYGFALPASGGAMAGDGYNVMPMLWGYGGDLLDASQKVNLTNPPAIKAFTVIQKLYTDGLSPVGSSFYDLRNLFGQGVIGFFWDLGGMAASAMAQAAPDKDEFYKNLGTMVIPREKGPDGHGYLTEQSIIVFKSCGDDKMPAMGRFLAHMTGSEVLDILYKGNQGKLSSRKSVMTEVFSNVEDPIILTCVDAIKSGRYLPYSLHFMDADKLLSDALTRLAQKEDVNVVMRDTQAKIHTLYDKK
ncbi:MAG: sugar ABC transporter substrate-binding protein [Treponema sp.]|jgi:ABC-type glycerol-3-phosphate transport system substrate-binding protein|nr:sugar ABC transporter substrate-binding protein [Treponema sp.]